MGQFAVAAVSDRRKVLINKIRRSETAATAAKTYHYQKGTGSRNIVEHRKSKKQSILDAAQSLGIAKVGESEIRRIQAYLVRQLGPAAKYHIS